MIELTDYMRSGIIEFGITVRWGILIMLGFAGLLLRVGLLLFQRIMQE